MKFQIAVLLIGLAILTNAEAQQPNTKAKAKSITKASLAESETPSKSEIGTSINQTSPNPEMVMKGLNVSALYSTAKDWEIKGHVSIASAKVQFATEGAPGLAVHM